MKPPVNNPDCKARKHIVGFQQSKETPVVVSVLYPLSDSYKMTEEHLLSEDIFAEPRALQRAPIQ